MPLPIGASAPLLSPGALVNEFLAAWDGVASGGGRVLVVGTTNRHGSMLKVAVCRATAGHHGLLRLHLEA